MPDKTIQCGDCNEEFVWSERDQEFYKKMDFSPPKRCRPCRAQRKAEREDPSHAGGRRR